MDKLAFFLLLMAVGCAPFSTKAPTVSNRGALLEDLTWIEAQKVLTPETVVVIPLGAQAKEHGPHLKLKNDFLIAEFLKKRVIKELDVVVAPTVNYHYYPAFLEYPGSTHLRLETAKNVIIDICEHLAQFGPKKFYVLNTGVSTIKALKPAAASLKKLGITLAYTDVLKVDGGKARQILQQEGGTHADELETSIMLYMHPETVDMAKAVKDYNPDRPGGLTRNPDGEGVFSPTGIWGDPTLASKEKGKVIVEAKVNGILREITQLQKK